tara:strand:- start:89 stop:739 length:651 start_codon:yes stop_codon:yes gene_type:complete
MIYSKICGVSDSNTLKFIINHKYPPRFVGFIVNYKKSKRYLNYYKLKKLLKNKNKKVKYVAVLVNPENKTIKQMKALNKFDYLQLYNVTRRRTKEIKLKFKFKIISAITIKNKLDIIKYKNFTEVSDIILFDSKGYEKSMRFDHSWVKKIPNTFNKMLAGNILYNENLDKFRKITDIIDISGSLETNGKKDLKKINIFLKNLKKINDKIKKKNSIN